MKKFFSLLLLSLFFLFSFAQSPNNLSIISFNIRYSDGNDSLNHWNYRKEAVVKMIKSSAADVIGIQEALANQIDYLDAALPQYARVGIGRDDGAKKGEFAAIYYLKSRFIPVNTGNFWLSETPDVPSRGWDAACNRIVTWIHLDDTISNDELYLFNTHFDHIGTTARKESALLLFKKMEELAYCFENNIFITGDFNTGSDDPLFLPLKKYFHSARESALLTDKSATFNDFGKTENTNTIIDHIFYTKTLPKEFRVVKENYGVPYISDHYPVIGVFEYR